MKMQITKENRRRWLVWLIVIESAIALFWLCIAVSHAANNSAGAAAPPSPAIPVSTEPAQVRDIDVTLDALGAVTPVNTVTITSRVAGVLQEVHYTEGQMVKQKDLLAVIDPRLYEAAVAQAQGQLARDEAQLANARLDLERYQTAVREHAVPEQQAATQEAVVHADEGTVKLDQASLQAAQVNLAYAHITSPIDGRMGLRLIDQGNNVAANGTSGIVVITQLQPITVVFTLAQEYLPQVLDALRGGEKLRVEAFDRAHSQAIAQGELLTIDNLVDQASGTFRLKATFANAESSLWPGEFVNVRFVVSTLKNVITVPTRAVQRGPQGAYVYVVKPDLLVEIHDVKIGRTDHDVTVISGGLKANERVVVDGQYRLQPGAKVALQTPVATTPST